MLISEIFPYFFALWILYDCGSVLSKSKSWRLSYIKLAIKYVMKVHEIDYEQNRPSNEAGVYSNQVMDDMGWPGLKLKI